MAACGAVSRAAGRGMGRVNVLWLVPGLGGAKNQGSWTRIPAAMSPRALSARVVGRFRLVRASADDAGRAADAKGQLRGSLISPAVSTTGRAQQTRAAAPIGLPTVCRNSSCQQEWLQCGLWSRTVSVARNRFGSIVTCAMCQEPAPARRVGAGMAAAACI